MNKANYAIESEDETKIVLRDIGPWHEHLTITNDAEQVVAELKDRLAGRRLFYWDSDGEPTELRIGPDGRSVGFAWGLVIAQESADMYRQRHGGA